MIKKVRQYLVRDFGIPLFILATLFFSCATTGINRFQPNIFTDEQEITLGQRLSEEVDREFKFFTRPEVVTYLNEIGQKLARVSDWPELEYRFKIVLDTAQVNAFALPGGHIYVYTALLKEADSEAELAGVLAHEIGHVTARHATERLTLLYGYDFALQLLLGQDRSVLSDLVANLFATGGILAYSRKNELEADKLAVRYMVRAGYDPNGFVSFLEKLQKLHQDRPSRLETWFSTHPAIAERIQRAKQLIAKMDAPPWQSRRRTLQKNENAVAVAPNPYQWLQESVIRIREINLTIIVLAV